MGACHCSARGASGYGHFNVEDWTQLRLTVLSPAKEPPYPIISKLANTAEANGTGEGVSSKVNGTSNH